uniref:Uncharacterized protein n=1 Tax=Anguilla anguilla TaxID=7936 RepID=A0A0E9TI18_ANGAN
MQCAQQTWPILSLEKFEHVNQLDVIALLLSIKPVSWSF